MSIQRNKAERKKTEFRVEWLNTILECVTIIICDHDAGIPKLKKLTSKLSNMYDCSGSVDMKPAKFVIK